MLKESVTSWSTLTSWFTPSILFVLLNLMIATIYITSSLNSSKPKDHHHNDPPPAQQPLQHPHLARSPSLLHRLKSINFYSYGHRSEPPPPEEKDTLFSHNYQESHHHYQTHDQEHENSVAFYRSPSSLLERVRSFNISKFISPEKPTLDRPLPTEQGTPFQHENEGDEQDDDVEEEVEDEDEDEEEVVGEKQTLDDIYSQLKGNSNHTVVRSKSDNRTTDLGRNVPEREAEKLRKSASERSAVVKGEDGGDAVEVRRPATVREGKGKMLVDEEVDAKADDFINRFKQQLKLQRMDSLLRYKEMIGRGISGK